MTFLLRRAAIIGLVTGLALAFGAHGISTAAIPGFALVLTGIAMVYPGALLRGEVATSEAVQELAAATATVAMVLLGLFHSPLWLALGYAGHGVWDWAHHAGFGTDVVAWFPPFCAVTDWVIALAILWIYLS